MLTTQKPAAVSRLAASFNKRLVKPFKNHILVETLNYLFNIKCSLAKKKFKILMIISSNEQIL